MGLTILEGSTFCICDEIGDLDGRTSGLFAEDTRFLSRLELRDRRCAAAPALVGEGRVLLGRLLPAQSATARASPGHALDLASALRRRRNAGASRRPQRGERGAVVRARARGRHRLRGHHLRQGARLRARQPAAWRGRCREPAPVRFDAAANQLVLEERRLRRRQDAGAALAPGRARRVGRPLPAAPAPRERAGTCASTSSTRSTATRPRRSPSRAASARSASTCSESLAAWRLRVPRLRTRREDMQLAFRQSVADLAALRMRGGRRRRRAAGRRHALVHDRLRPRHDHHLPPDDAVRARARDRVARRARRAAGARGRPVDRRRAGQDRPRAAPRQGGRDVVRRATTAPSTRRRSSSSCSPRSGAGRATRRSSSGCASRRSRRSRWIDEFGDRDGDGFVEYERRTQRGLENQSWKDSGDSQRFHDGRFAATPIAPCEVQGYVYDAKRAAGRARARGLARRRARRAARGGGRRAARRFDEAYWVEERGGFYALALDGEKQPVDSLCSNIGHLLWSGIVPPERVGRGRGPADGRRALVGLGRSARCRPPTPPTTRSATTTAPSGRTTRRSARGGSRAYGRDRRVAPDRARAARGGALLRLVAAGGVRRLRARRDALPDRLPDRGAAAGVGGRDAGAAAAAPARARAGPGVARRCAARRVRCPTGRTTLELEGVRAFGHDWDVAGRRRRSARAKVSADAGRRPQPGLVPRATVRLRRDRVDRRRCSPTGSPTRATK